ncbi:ABC transporter permease [Streptomyces radicis]|uniref:Transporter n=1 Tax=Streptomyces radicis TaxID=1750517 RepID=A0A3A9WD64_9ACTN|nr:ABC transporter permease [Streptomyces radicis]RKN10233.1 transporter [Streptomyces radicis]RKN24575.1 transporter [Streptomyces radicis]
MWVRSLMAYRLSFALTTLGSAAGSFLDYVAILIMFAHVEALGGFSVAEVALLYATTSVSLGLAELLLGNLSGLGRRIRDGTLDALLVRPAPLFAQVAADRFQLRRIGRIGQGLGVLVWAVTRLDLDWTVGRVLLLVTTVVAGAAIFCGIYTAGGAFQFVAQDAAEVQSSFTYGGNTLLQYPPTIFARELVRGVTFVVPLAFVNWLPTLRLLGRDDPLGLPGWVDFMSPVVAAVVCGIGALLWRAAVRSYRSTGS